MKLAAHDHAGTGQPVLSPHNPASRNKLSHHPNGGLSAASIRARLDHRREP